MTVYTPRTKPSTTYSGRSPLQSDLGAGLDYDDAIMTDENDDTILFHNGDFYDQDTQWTGRTIPL